MGETSLKVAFLQLWFLSLPLLALAALLVLCYAALLFTPASLLVARPSEEWRAAAAAVAAREQPGDLVSFDGAPGAAPFNLYYRGGAEQLTLARGQPPRSPRREARARDLARGRQRIWWVRSYYPLPPAAAARLQAGFTPAFTLAAGPGLEVTLLRRPPGR